MVTSITRMGKNLSDFDRGMIVGARQGGLNISEIVDLLGFSRTTVSRDVADNADIFADNGSRNKKHPVSSSSKINGQKPISNERSEENGQTGQSLTERSQ